MLGEYYKVIAAVGLQPSIGNLKYYLSYLFDGVVFADKTVLDIGGGSGYLSFYATCLGAKEVVCLEPEAGGTSPEFNKAFSLFRSKLGNPDVRHAAQTIQDYEEKRKFDIVIMHNSVNHLIEGCARLREDESLREKALNVFKKLYDYCEKDAVMIIVDYSRYHVFQLLGLRHPLALHVGWRHHETPEFWVTLLEKAGFKKKDLSWVSFNTSRSLGRILMNNRLSSYIFGLPFILTVHRPGNAAGVK